MTKNIQIRVTASRIMTAKEVKAECKRLKSDMEALQKMLDLQISIRNYIREIWTSQNEMKKAV